MEQVTHLAVTGQEGLPPRSFADYAELVPARSPASAENKSFVAAFRWSGPVVYGQQQQHDKKGAHF